MEANYYKLGTPSSQIEKNEQTLPEFDIVMTDSVSGQSCFDYKQDPESEEKKNQIENYPINLEAI